MVSEMPQIRWATTIDGASIAYQEFGSGVGFTAMSEAADPEDVDALSRNYSAIARQAIESHDGKMVHVHY